jgi:hypothetical protein
MDNVTDDSFWDCFFNEHPEYKIVTSYLPVLNEPVDIIDLSYVMPNRRRDLLNEKT